MDISNIVFYLLNHFVYIVYIYNLNVIYNFNLLPKMFLIRTK